MAQSTVSQMDIASFSVNAVLAGILVIGILGYEIPLIWPGQVSTFPLKKVTSKHEKIK